MKVLAFVSKRLGVSPGQRFRIEQWAPHLAARHGIEIHYAVFESPALTDLLYRPGHRAKKAALLLRDTWRRRRAVLDARRYDAAFVFREVALMGPPVYERALRAMGVPYVLDFDDAIWLPGQGGGINGAFTALRFPEKTKAIARGASAVTVGNSHLAEWARDFCSDVTVVPTTIDLSRFTLQPPRSDGDAFVVVWTGSFSTLRYLELIRRPLERLGRERRVELRVICDRPLDPPIAGVKTTFVPWSAASEAADLGGGDVGIMPLDDTPWSRGKCACKALQYMAVGRPTVLAPVGVNRDVVQHGVNGLFASTEDEWLTHLRALAEQPRLRESMAAAGRTTVEGGYSAEIGAALLAPVLRRIDRRSRNREAS